MKTKTTDEMILDLCQHYKLPDQYNFRGGILCIGPTPCGNHQKHYDRIACSLARQRDLEMNSEEWQAYMYFMGWGDTRKAIEVLWEVYNRHQTPETIEDLSKENKQLRVLLAHTYAGANLYADDGELQDARTDPFIDFKRDSVELIQKNIRLRTSKILEDFEWKHGTLVKKEN